MIAMKIEGVDGNCKISGHENWIQCKGLHWSAGRRISTETGKTSDRSGSIMQCQNIEITKEIDSSSAKLFELACGTQGKEVKIHFIYGTGDDATSYSEWTLENALISNYTIEANEEKKEEEHLSLNFVTIEIKSIPRGPNEGLSGPYPVKFSRETGKKG